jgi:dUTP pyrophosphatase
MEIKLLRENAQIPTQGSEWAAGWDLYAALEKENVIEIPPHETRMIPTGIAMAIPEGWWGGIYPRSGLASKQGLRPANCVGVIDPDYRGEIFVALHNDSDVHRAICNGDRIAQFIIHDRIVDEEGWKVVGELSSTTRGSGGFGSTGTN